MPIIRSQSNCRCSLWFQYECGGGSVLSCGRFVNKPTTAENTLLLCPSSEARQTDVAASGFSMNVEVEVFSAVVGLLTNRPRLRTLLLCPSSEARQTAVAASGFSMNVEVEVFSAVVGLLTNRPRLRTLYYYAHHQNPVKLPLQPLVSVWMWRWKCSQPWSVC